MRFLGFFLLVFAAMFLLRLVPGLGRLFEVPLIGFYLAAVLISVILARAGTSVVDRRKVKGEMRQLEAVDTPHNRGKLGTLHLQAGRAREAVPHLEAAAEGEPDSVEWHFRLGQGYLAAGRPEEAMVSLSRAAAIDEEHAYGGVLLSLALAQRAAGAPEEALATLERLERNTGPSAESAYRRGQVYKALGDRDRARAAFAEVGSLAALAPKYQRAAARGWAVKAFWAKLF